MSELSMPPFAIPYTSRPIGTNTMGVGKVFYVDAWTGNNDNSGIRPGEAFNTITYALTQVVAHRNDYIICFDTWQQEPAWPIELLNSHHRVHILGFTNPPGLGSYMYPDVDEPTFHIALTENPTLVEIAGFNLGGGANHGCIEIGSSQRNWIHHCWFGNADQLAGNTPLRGIDVPTGPVHFLTIEDCVFLGDENNIGGGISENGIEIGGNGGWMTIRRNRIMGCTIGIRIYWSRASMIYNNLFVCPDAAGAAITLRAHANNLGNMVTGNVAMEGAETAMVTNPFEDENNNDANHFGDNRCTLVAGAVDLAHLAA